MVQETIFTNCSGVLYSHINLCAQLCVQLCVHLEVRVVVKLPFTSEHKYTQLLTAQNPHDCSPCKPGQQGGVAAVEVRVLVGLPRGAVVLPVLLVEHVVLQLDFQVKGVG